MKRESWNAYKYSTLGTPSEISQYLSARKHENSAAIEKVEVVIADPDETIEQNLSDVSLALEATEDWRPELLQDVPSPKLSKTKGQKALGKVSSTLNDSFFERSKSIFWLVRPLCCCELPADLTHNHLQPDPQLMVIKKRPCSYIRWARKKRPVVAPGVWLTLVYKLLKRKYVSNYIKRE